MNSYIPKLSAKGSSVYQNIVGRELFSLLINGLELSNFLKGKSQDIKN